MPTAYTEKNFNFLLEKLSEVMRQRNASLLLARAALSGASRRELEEAFQVLETEINNSTKHDNNTSKP